MPAAPAPDIVIRTEPSFLPTTRSALVSAASTTIAVPCWSSWKTGMSSRSRSRALDLEAPRGADVLEVDAAEGGRDDLDGAHDLVGVLGVQAHRPRVDAREPLEQRGLALHHRHRRVRADVAQAQHGRAVGDHRDAVALDGQPAHVLRVARRWPWRPGPPRGVGHGQVVPVAQRDLDRGLDLPAQVQQEGPVADLADQRRRRSSLSACTIASACSVSRAAQVRSTRSRSWLNGVTSRAVTAPPACSTTWVSSLTARPRDGTSSRTVIEYDTLGATDTSSRLPPGPVPDPIVPPGPMIGLAPGGRTPAPGARTLQGAAATYRQCARRRHGRRAPGRPADPADGPHGDAASAADIDVTRLRVAIARVSRQPAAARAGRADPDPAVRAGHGGAGRAAAARRPGRRGEDRPVHADPAGHRAGGPGLRAARRGARRRPGQHAGGDRRRARHPGADPAGEHHPAGRQPAHAQPRTSCRAGRGAARAGAAWPTPAADARTADRAAEGRPAAREPRPSEQQAGQGGPGPGHPRVPGREHLEQVDQVHPGLVPVLAGGPPDRAEQPVEPLLDPARWPPRCRPPGPARPTSPGFSAAARRTWAWS